MQHVIALVHEEQGRYGISFPDFPGCVSGGKSLDEAVSRGAAALAAHAQALLEGGDPLPRLRSMEELRRDATFKEDAQGAIITAVPVDLPGRSVRLNISMDEHLVAAIDRAASQAGQSRSAFLAAAARRRIAEGA